MTSVPLDQFESTFGKLIGELHPFCTLAPHSPLTPSFRPLSELSSEALGGSIVNVSDDFFASATCLLRVPVSRPY